MKRRNRLSLVLLFLALLVTACTPRSVPEGFDETQVMARASEVITLLSQKEYAAVTATFHPVMSSLDAKALESAVGPGLDKLGALQSIGKGVFSSGNQADIGPFAVTVIPCQYEKGKATFTISVDGEGRICGLYMR